MFISRRPGVRIADSAKFGLVGTGSVVARVLVSGSECAELISASSALAEISESMVMKSQKTHCVIRTGQVLVRATRCKLIVFAS